MCTNQLIPATRQLARRYSTFKSINDEEKNQNVLNLMRQLKPVKEHKIVVKPSSSEINDTTVNPDECRRSLTLVKLAKLIEYHQVDPLTWNSTVLSKIYRIPEGHCSSAVRYISPLSRYVNIEFDSTQRVMKSCYIFDVGLMVNDKSYMHQIKKTYFPKVKPSPEISDTEFLYRPKIE